MQARGYCGDLFPSVLCAVLCSWSWFLFVSIAGSLAGWEDLRGWEAACDNAELSVAVFLFLSPNLHLQLWSFIPNSGYKHQVPA